MPERAPAVFLSYASQDAEAAHRIAESLRASGVEVWFDVEGGLEHGDEWDAKIRRQIKECVLFIPLISANTQARLEGYFRLEWELAAQRAMGIAAGRSQWAKPQCLRSEIAAPNQCQTPTPRGRGVPVSHRTRCLDACQPGHMPYGFTSPPK